LRELIKTIIFFTFLFFVTNLQAQSSNPPVKKSNSGICHPKGGSYYSRTKNFESYETMDECIKSGGRKPKR